MSLLDDCEAKTGFSIVMIKGGFFEREGGGGFSRGFGRGFRGFSGTKNIYSFQSF